MKCKFQRKFESELEFENKLKLENEFDNANEIVELEKPVYVRNENGGRYFQNVEFVGKNTDEYHRWSF